MRRAPRPLVALIALVVASALAVVGCSSKGSVGKSPFGVATTTTGPPPAVTAGRGYLQLGGQYYPFEVVGCRQGRSKDDPKGASRIFGVYANGTTQGQLFTVELTRYQAIATVATGPATITDTALVRMQGGTKAKPVVIGLRAQRAHIVSSERWVDKLDPPAQTQLITTVGDHYSAQGRFGPDDAQAGDKGILSGRVEAVCPVVADTSASSTS